MKLHLFIMLSIAWIMAGCSNDDSNDSNSSTPKDENTQTDPGNTGNNESGNTGNNESGNTGNNESGNTGNNESDNQDPDRVCGTSSCKGNELCMSEQCIERDNKAIEGKSCNPNKFLESCEGNQLVYCDSETKLTAISNCDEGGYLCALKIRENMGFCVKEDPLCTQAGTVKKCINPTTEETGMSAYLEFFDCAHSTDDKYYLYKTWKTEDCVGVCGTETSCALSDETCDAATYKETCTDDGAAITCADGKVFRINCKSDYGVTCSIDDAGHADCNYDEMN